VKLNSRYPKSLRWFAATAVLPGLLLVAAAFAANPIPQVVGPPNPQAVAPGSGAFTLTVYGANFVSGVVVNWNRSPRSTTFVSARELQAQILASDVATATAGYITVTNPAPGGGVSSSSYAQVEVHTPTATIVARKPHSYLPNNTPWFLLLSDFNNDGILDFGATDGYDEIKVLLGNGDGTFGHGSVVTHKYYGSGPAAIASGDFNNDRNEDLVFGADPNGPPTQLQVALGDGNGKFRNGSRFGRFDNNSGPTDIAVGDFNGDGKLDLAVATGGAGVLIFQGNGDGTFQRPRSYATTYGSAAVVLGDFNGDGKLDLVLNSGYELQILFGNGDGTFQKARHIASFRSAIGWLVLTDFNGDGNLDLAVAERDQTNGKIWIILGNGDGTFKKPIAIPIPNGGINGFSFTAGDFNSDGKTDLVANYSVSFSQTKTYLYLGNGDGTFRAKKIVNLPGSQGYNAELGLVPADLNSDGLLDFIFKEPGVVSVFVQK
jgi:hypothetical protein